MSSEYPIDNPPQPLVETTGARVQTQREKSAVREAITEVCEARIGARGSKLHELLDKIEEKDGPAAAFDRLIKLLEFSQPKLQRVTVQKSDEAPKMPTFILNIGASAPKVVGETLDLEVNNGDE